MTNEGSVTLRDGRVLSYAERGPADGFPVLHFHGLPTCRLELDYVEPEAYERRGLRVVCPDRPGIGASTRQRGRGIGDWVGDVAAFADGLGIDRFAVSGLSAGGPYALACAHRLPERVLGVGVLCGVAPREAPGGHRMLCRGDRVMFALARRAPALGAALVLQARRKARRKPERFVEEVRRDFPSEPDVAALAGPAGGLFRTIFLEATRNGAGGVVDDYRALGDDWGFALDEIDLPVHWVHGELDRTVPLEHGRWAADRIPGGELTVAAGEGHLLAPSCVTGMWARLKEAADAYV
ncbi:MAG TPA: alpha/beta hydrolase [Solirubrobacteraceae bacterium]|nr:alpha/beta hydrolase [Solirubrobacteraceae bacterium]